MVQRVCANLAAAKDVLGKKGGASGAGPPTAHPGNERRQLHTETRSQFSMTDQGLEPGYQLFDLPENSGFVLLHLVFVFEIGPGWLVSL